MAGLSFYMNNVANKATAFDLLKKRLKDDMGLSDAQLREFHQDGLSYDGPTIRLTNDDGTKSYTFTMASRNFADYNALESAMADAKIASPAATADDDNDALLEVYDALSGQIGEVSEYLTKLEGINDAVAKGELTTANGLRQLRGLAKSLNTSVNKINSTEAEILENEEALKDAQGKTNEKITKAKKAISDEIGRRFNIVSDQLSALQKKADYISKQNNELSTELKTIADEINTKILALNSDLSRLIGDFRKESAKRHEVLTEKLDEISAKGSYNITASANVEKAAGIIKTKLESGNYRIGKSEIDKVWFERQKDDKFIFLALDKSGLEHYIECSFYKTSFDSKEEFKAEVENLKFANSASNKTSYGIREINRTKSAISNLAFRAKEKGSDAIGYIKDKDNRKKVAIIATAVVAGVTLANVVLHGVVGNESEQARLAGRKESETIIREVNPTDLEGLFGSIQGEVDDYNIEKPHIGYFLRGKYPTAKAEGAGEMYGLAASYLATSAELEAAQAEGELVSYTTAKGTKMQNELKAVLSSEDLGLSERVQEAFVEGFDYGFNQEKTFTFADLGQEGQQIVFEAIASKVDGYIADGKTIKQDGNVLTVIDNQVVEGTTVTIEGLGDGITDSNKVGALAQFDEMLNSANTTFTLEGEENQQPSTPTLPQEKPFAFADFGQDAIDFVLDKVHEKFPEYDIQGKTVELQGGTLFVGDETADDFSLELSTSTWTAENKDAAYSKFQESVDAKIRAGELKDLRTHMVSFAQLYNNNTETIKNAMLSAINKK